MPASTTSTIPGQHETGAGAALGRHLAPGVVQARSARGQRQGARRRVQPRADAGRAADRRRRTGGRSKGCQAPTNATRRWPRPAAGVMNQHAAAREPAAQHLARLGARLRPAGPRALRDPRQLQLQADRPAAGLRRVLAAAAAAEARRLRLRLPGVRPPRAARRAAQLRAGDEPDPDGQSDTERPRASERGLMRAPDRLSRQGRVARPRRALPDHGRARPAATPRCSACRCRIARGLWPAPASQPGDKVAILSGNDPVAFACVFGISRAGAVWCPINPRNEAAENRFILDAVRLPLPDLPQPLRAAGRARSRRTCRSSRTLVCLDARTRRSRRRFETWLAGVDRRRPCRGRRRSTISSMIAGTGGTTGKPKGVMLTGRNIETMTALTLMSYPFEGAPGLSGARAADPRGRRAVLPDHGARRRDRHHAARPISASSSH